MKRRGSRRSDPIERGVEISLDLGEYVGYRQSFVFGRPSFLPRANVRGRNRMVGWTTMYAFKANLSRLVDVAVVFHSARTTPDGGTRRDGSGNQIYVGTSDAL